MATAPDPARGDPDAPHRQVDSVRQIAPLDHAPQRCDVLGGKPLEARVGGQHHLVAEGAGRRVRRAGALDEASPQFAVVGASGVDVAGLDVRDDLAHERCEQPRGVGVHSGQIQCADHASCERIDDRMPVATEIAQHLGEVLLSVDEHPTARLQRGADPVVAHRVLGENRTVVYPATEQHPRDLGCVANGADDLAVAVRQHEHGAGVAQDRVQIVHDRAGGLGEPVGAHGLGVGRAGARALRGQAAQRRSAPGQVQLVAVGTGRDG